MAYVNLQEMAEQAFHHIEKKEFEKAESKLSYILNNHPDNPTVYYFLGCLYLEKKQYAFALMAYEKALQYQPQFDECINNMSTAYRQVGRLDKCIEAFKKAVEIASHPAYQSKFSDITKAKHNLADYMGNLGSCYVARGTPDEALKHLNKALEIFPGLSNAMWNAGLAYLEKGEYDRGWNGYEYGDRISDEKERSYHGGPKSTSWWNGPTEGKKPTIVVYGEQGIGDEIMFASMIPDVMQDANVILEAHPRLQNMFRLAFPSISVYGTRKATQVNWAKMHQIDAKIAIGSLGKFYRQTKEQFPGVPYLKSDEKLEELITTKYLMPLTKDNKAKRKIGISWKGGIGITNKAVRRIEFETLKPLLELDADFISLQYDVNARAELDKFNESMGREVIHHWQDVVDDYDQTAALLTQLDLVVSVPQSVVHLAGALGVPTIQLCPKQALWQMGPYGEDMPWYSSVTNIWQKTDGDWKTVIDMLITELKENHNVNHG